MKFSRRQWLLRLPVLAGGGGFAYGSLVEKQRLSLTRRSIPLDSRHEALRGLRIAALADFHHDDFGDEKLVRRAVEAINREQVDLVLLLGDYISSEAEAIDALAAELTGLRSRLGTFAILGNHDRWNPGVGYLIHCLEQAGARVLVDEAFDFTDFALAGMDSFDGRSNRLPVALREIPRDRPTLLAWHEPDSFDLLEDPRVALQLSGHTHGGQICAPFFGPILLPPRGRHYPYGHYRRGSASLFVTRGIGTLTIPARFLCPPEVALLTLGN